jgi:hypothetical protein
MEAKNGNKPLWLSILRWSARIIAIIFIAFYLMMFIGEGGLKGRSGTLPSLTARDYIMLSFAALYVIGLIIGLWREGLGGLISLIILVIHIIILQSEGVKSLMYFYFMALPSILFILSWYFHLRSVRQ